ncbi:hypothetical protein EDEG_01592 [Edhazardia aedis USNM 41457]|uniref:Uncharacterized protein n=1 Tax=Edhazardia aedis (strain USNM 41457) TaxID=1003232 RepID=J9DS43_EDHAE|nr:hypothetical protein EDEG_01592 [Edhazardia aedis USNM 41457]|eukprot:EJW04112.1 hypothetical protein EDEG_01592 [Edhazardia aedis USNM 41457]
MVVFLEKEGTKRSTLEINTIEAFTQKTYRDLISTSHHQKNDYFLCRIRTVDGQTNCYDARQLCKYVFEMVISPKQRLIRVKNFKDPLSHSKIADISFFRLKHDTEEKMRSEYMGNHSDFLASNCFRNKIFYREDAMYALSVNFDLQESKRVPIIGKKQVFSLFATIIVILLISTFLVVILERESFLRTDVFPNKKLIGV